ncbi:MAG TPA: PIN domain-containing protein [Candidatus Nanoarchaeia archaeon]|nr:PIN domain-containing protein [Candidatus Nanoarchaeia archaeon]
MTDVFFFDSYALFEIVKGNPSYEPYLNTRLLITKLNLFELYYGLLRTLGEQDADIWVEKYKEFVIDFDISDVKAAAQLRLAFKSEDLSMTDCIGYVLAKKWGVPFLTGDVKFEKKPNVNYIK